MLLYTGRRRLVTWGDDEVIALTLGTGTRTVLAKDAVDARYIPTGHLVFLRRGQLFAAPFDPERLTVGPEVPLLDQVAQALTDGDGGTKRAPASSPSHRRGRWPGCPPLRRRRSSPTSS